MKSEPFNFSRSVDLPKEKHVQGLQRRESTSRLHNAAKALRRSLSGKNIPNKYKKSDVGNIGDPPKRSQSVDKMKRRSVTSSTMLVDEEPAMVEERPGRLDRRSHSFHGGRGDAKKLAKITNLVRREGRSDIDLKKRQSLDVGSMRKKKDR